jgi:hypothetical protein
MSVWVLWNIHRKNTPPFEIGKTTIDIWNHTNKKIVNSYLRYWKKDFTTNLSEVGPKERVVFIVDSGKVDAPEGNLFLVIDEEDISIIGEFHSSFGGKALVEVRDSGIYCKDYVTWSNLIPKFYYKKYRLVELEAF